MVRDELYRETVLAVDRGILGRSGAEPTIALSDGGHRDGVVWSTRCSRYWLLPSMYTSEVIRRESALLDSEPPAVSWTKSAGFWAVGWAEPATTKPPWSQAAVRRPPAIHPVDVLSTSVWSSHERSPSVAREKKRLER